MVKWAILLGLAGLASGQAAPPIPTAQPSRAEALSKEAVNLINAERAKQKLPAFQARRELTEAAMWLAQDMADRGYFSHEDSRGKRVRDRVGERQYRWSMLGENIAAGQESAVAVVAAWAQSEKHRKNMLHTGYTEIGVGYGYREGSEFGHYWVTVFGKPQ